MNYSRFMSICRRELNFVKRWTPFDTGNLRFNAIKTKVLNTPWNCTYTIYVDLSEAYYMIYTNEPWISARWNGKKNPNEHWWDKTALAVASRIMKNINGKSQDFTPPKNKQGYTNPISVGRHALHVNRYLSYLKNQE